LSWDANAVVLAEKFGCSVDKILMNSPVKNQASPIECWLKDIEDLTKGNRFVEHWDGRTLLGSQIKCEIEEDKSELCKYFRLGKCRNTHDDCDWTHIECTANGKCPNDCPYGHAAGMKTGYLETGKLHFSSSGGIFD
jgi:hypothetical protein